MKKQIILLTLALIAVLVSVSAVSAASINVGPGQTYTDIKNAVGNASANDTIIVANGIYTGENNTNITINKNLAIIGQSQAGTIIDANHQGYIFYVDDGYTVIISQLTLRDGEGHSDGGAIYNDGTCNVNSVTFDSNCADDCCGGGAIYNEDTMTLTNCIFTNNTAYEDGEGGHGGAIHNYYGNMTITGCTFADNYAEEDGGVIYDYYGSLTITGSTFTGNEADYDGGAIFTDYGEITITGSTFTGNGAYYDGGAIVNNYGDITITGSTFTGNVAGDDGGAIHNEDELTITDSTFSNNIADDDGGAIHICCGEAILTRCIFNNNTAADGGAIEFSDESLTITGCNFNKNHATDDGGAISGEDPFVVKYSRFVGNTAAESGQDIFMDGNEGGLPTLDARYNWWGSNAGPAVGRLIGYNGNMDINLPSSTYSPWLVMNIKAVPSTIYTGETSKIIADVFKDSAGGDHSADAALFFSGPEVIFTTDLGNVGSKNVTVPWTLGMAFAILRGDEGPGIATVTAADGSAIVSTTVTILQAPEVNAATVGMQKTGLPVAGLILAILAVLGGSLAPKRK